MSGGSDRIDKLNFELTQSVTASDGSVFGKGDTVEVSFVGKGTAYHGAYTEQYVDLYYATDSKTTPTWQQFGKFPKPFFSPGNLDTTSYVTRSFVAGMTNTVQALKMVITGSVNSTSSYDLTLNNNGGSLDTITLTGSSTASWDDSITLMFGGYINYYGSPVFNNNYNANYGPHSCQPSRIQRDSPAFRHLVPCPARTGQKQGNVPHFNSFSITSTRMS